MKQRELTGMLRELAAEVKRTKPNYPRNVVPGCPIPFFGNVLRARALTIGVNPSNGEFKADRGWRQPLKLLGWQERLLSYFNWPGVPPHEWFDTWSACLEILGLSYTEGTAAHVDVSPRPTIPMLDPSTYKPEFRSMVEHDLKWFFQLLDQLPQVQFLLVAGPIPTTDGGKQQLADFVREQAERHGAEWNGSEPLPRLVTPIHRNGIPVFVCSFEPGVDGCYAMIRQVYRAREVLRRLSAPIMISVPILPARLDWSSAVGLFLINYGTLDYFVFALLKDHLSPDDFAKVKEWHFKDRVNRIELLLREQNFPTKQQAAFLRLRERLEPIRELRNYIAHGHMYLQFDPETRKQTVTLFKAKDLDTGFLPESEHVEFAELEAALSILVSLVEEFQRLAGFDPAA